MAWVATELSLKNPFAPRLEQVACLTEKQVVVASKNNSRSRYLKSCYVSVKFTYSPTTRVFRRTIFFHQAEIADSGFNVGRRVFFSERFFAENAGEVPRN